MSAEAIRKLGDEYWEFVLRNNPVYATYLGDTRYDDRLPDPGAENRARVREAAEELLNRVLAVDESGLNEADRVSRDILRRKLQDTLNEQNHLFHQWQIDQLSGPQLMLFELINFHPRKTRKNAEDLLARFKAYPGYIDATVSNLREGLEAGRIAPKIILERILAQLDGILKSRAGESPLTPAINRIPDEAEAVRDELRSTARSSIYPSLESLQSFLRDELLPKSREEVGIWAIPGGAEAYEFCVASHTTAGYSSDELHEMGLEELRSIRNEMQAIAKGRGHDGDLKSFQESLKGDAAHFVESPEELLEGFRAVLRRIDAKLPQYFGALPKVEYEVKAIEPFREKDAPAAFYHPPSEDGSRKGIFYANTHETQTRPRFNWAALAAHEAVPGHHLQIALSMEMDALPKFRRHGHFTAYVEGWGLYSERLADEMGIYEDDLSVFGMLTYQAWRACRLVVDTGLHARKWSRQKAIDFFREHLTIASQEILNEIDRYIIWPGQALGYMLGCREIRQIRSDAERKLGDAFNLSTFHDVVLRNGPIPLSTLKNVVDNWAGSQKT